MPVSRRSGGPAADPEPLPSRTSNRDRRPTSRALGEADTGEAQAGRGAGQARGGGIGRGGGGGGGHVVDSTDSGHGVETSDEAGGPDEPVDSMKLLKHWQCHDQRC